MSVPLSRTDPRATSAASTPRAGVAVISVAPAATAAAAMVLIARLRPQEPGVRLDHRDLSHAEDVLWEPVAAGRLV